MCELAVPTDVPVVAGSREQAGTTVPGGTNGQSSLWATKRPDGPTGAVTELAGSGDRQHRLLYGS